MNPVVAAVGSLTGLASAGVSLSCNLEAETLRQRQKWTRRWYLLVIVLLYIGLLASFSLNVSLLLRKPTTSSSTVQSSMGPTASLPEHSASLFDTGGGIVGDSASQGL